MTDATARIQARKEKLLKATKILKKYLAQPNEVKEFEISHEALLRMGMKDDCVLELAVLTNDLIGWLDDDGYFDELAWELEGKPAV